MRKKIYLHLSGGIGNQLFQYAAAKNLSIINNAELILDKTTGFITDLKFKRKYSLNYVETLKNKSPNVFLFFLFRLFKKLFFSKKLFYKFFNIKIIDEYYSFRSFYPEIIKVKFDKKLYLLGLFQSEKYFNQNKKIIIDEIFPKEPKNINYIKQASEIDDKSVAVCIRNFEDLPKKLFSTVGGVNDHTFYENSLKLFLDKIHNPKFYFFSTNKKNIQNIIYKIDLLNDHEKIIITNETGYKNDIDTLWLMSKFKNFIISNSTFYWWGAYFANVRSNKTEIISSRKFPNVDTNQKNWIVI